MNKQLWAIFLFSTSLGVASTQGGNAWSYLSGSNAADGQVGERIDEIEDRGFLALPGEVQLVDYFIQLNGVRVAKPKVVHVAVVLQRLAQNKPDCFRRLAQHIFGQGDQVTLDDIGTWNDYGFNIGHHAIRGVMFNNDLEPIIKACIHKDAQGNYSVHNPLLEEGTAAQELAGPILDDKLSQN